MTRKIKKRAFVLKKVGLEGIPVDTEFNIDCDNHGVPLNSFWRARLLDAKKDGNMLPFVKPKRSDKQ